MIQLHCEQAHPCEVAVSTHLSHLAIQFTRAGPTVVGEQTLNGGETTVALP